MQTKTRPDRRIVRTQRLLRAALIELTLEKGFDRLTIRDLTERADIGYATFFRHFKSKDELLRSIFQNAFEALVANTEAAPSPYQYAVEIYRFANDHRDLMRVYLSLPKESQFRQTIFSQMRDQMLRDFRPNALSSVPLEISVRQILEAVHELVRMYLDDIDKYTPEQFALIHFELISNANQSIDFVLREDEQADPPPN